MNKRIPLSISIILILSLIAPRVIAQGTAPNQPDTPDLPKHIPGEILISFIPGARSSNATQKLEELGLEHVKEIEPIGVHLVKLPPGLSVEKALQRFSHLPEVKFAEPNYIYQITATTQAEIDDQWGLKKIKADQAWGMLSEEERNPILLATIDTGIDRYHDDLSGNIWVNPGEIQSNGIDDDGNGKVDDWWGWDFVNGDNEPFDDNLHGTGVSSVMVGIQDGTGVAGVCPWCQVMSVKSLGADGSGTLAVVAEGINYAAQMGARAINLSLTGPHGDTLEAAVNNAWNLGAVVVAAAGNHGLNTTMYPSGYANAMGVASTDENDYHSCFSNHAENSISVSAPGEQILMAEPNQSYGIWSGTSLSSPHVAGLAGLLFSQDVSRTNNQVRTQIETTADDLGPPGMDAAFGYGRINAYRALGYGPPSAIPEDGVFSISDTTTGYAHARKLVRDDTGLLHIIWHTKEGSNYRIRYANSIDSGTTWNLMSDVYTSFNETYHPALATDGEYLFVAIPSRSGPDTNDPYEILFTRKLLPDGDWETTQPLMGGTYNAVRPDMYFDLSNNRLHVIASSLDDAPYLYYRGSSTQGDSWDAVSQFNPSNLSRNTRYATIHANGDNLYVATKVYENLFIFTYYYLHTARSVDGGETWIDQTQISSYLAATTGEYGVSMAGVGDRLYMGYEVGSNIYFRRYDGAGWSNYLELETGAPNLEDPIIFKWPTITQAEDGRAWLMFEEHKQLYMRHYDGSTWAEKESIGSGTYANFKLGTKGDQIEWLSTSCNSSPFAVVYGSRSLISNTPPVADDQSVTTEEDTSIGITLTASDLDNDPITYIVLTVPAHGSLSGTPPNLTYTPDTDYNGPDSFTFIANDGIEDSNIATVSITITPVNDPPVANPQVVTTDEDTSVAITLTGDDVDGDELTYNVLTGTTNGSLTGTAPNLTYTPIENYYGPDSFTFVVNDGNLDSSTATIDITITPVNDPPVADNQTEITNEDTAVPTPLTGSDVENDPLTFSILTFPVNGGLSGAIPDLIYTPNENFFGSDSFNFQANDGLANSNTATISIIVTSVNDPPLADDQVVTTSENTAVDVTLTASDVEGDPLTYNVVSDPTNGTLSGTAPNLAYTPDPHYIGVDSFTFKANDGQVDSNIATVDVTITAGATVVDALATSEIFGAGTVNGDFTYTHVNDGVSESITERDSGGKPINRYSYLKHTWTFEVTPGNVVTLFANAWSSDSSDGDSFIFAYSTDDVTYKNMFTVSGTTDSDYEAYGLPASIQGTIYVRVVDGDHTLGNRANDTIFVDHLYIRSETQPGDPPNAPSELNASAVSASQIDLSWIDNSDDEFGFKIERSLDTFSWSEIASVGANTTSYNDMGLSPNTSYYYRVLAYNGSGPSAHSNETSATTQDGLILTGTGYKVKGVHVVDLEWSGSGATLFDIFRDGADIATGVTDKSYSDNTGNKGGASYQYQVCESSTPINCSNTVQIDF